MLLRRQPIPCFQACCGNKLHYFFRNCLVARLISTAVNTSNYRYFIQISNTHFAKKSYDKRLKDIVSDSVFNNQVRDSPMSVPTGVKVRKRGVGEQERCRVRGKPRTLHLSCSPHPPLYFKNYTYYIAL